jgi:hypothetical protein
MDASATFPARLLSVRPICYAAAERHEFEIEARHGYSPFASLHRMT